MKQTIPARGTQDDLTVFLTLNQSPVPFFDGNFASPVTLGLVFFTRAGWPGKASIGAKGDFNMRTSRHSLRPITEGGKS
jgi:hypothetical protein